MTGDQAAKAIVMEHYAAIDGQHWERQASLIAGDFVAILGGAEPCSFSAWLAKLKQFYRGMPTGRHDLEFYAAEGGRVISIGRFAGIQDGEFFGVARTGRAISMAVMHVDRVIDDKIVEHVAQSDIAGLLRQLQ